MKHAIQHVALALTVLLCGHLAFAQGTSSPVKDDLFAGTEKFARGASDVTEVTMDPDTLDIVGGKDAKRAHSMVLNVVRTYEYDKPGMYNIADVEEIRQRLNTGDWHCSVHTRDTKRGESTDICYKRRADNLTEQAIITVEPKELTFIHTIRHRNGEGGSLEGFDLPGVGLFNGAPLMAMANPAMKAEMLAMQAELRAHAAEMGSVHSFNSQLFFHDPHWTEEQQKQLNDQLQHMPAFKPEQLPQLEKQLNNLPKPSPEQMQQLQNQVQQLAPTP